MSGSRERNPDRGEGLYGLRPWMPELTVCAVLVLALLGACWVWTFGWPYADHACHVRESRQLDRYESSVRDLMPVRSVRRSDECRLGAGPELQVDLPRGPGVEAVGQRFADAGWTLVDRTYQSPDGTILASIGLVPDIRPTYVSIYVRGWDYQAPSDD